MQYIANSTEIEYTSNADGIIEFRHDGVLYRSEGQATFDNSPNNNYSTYSVPLVCPEDAEHPEDTVGKIEWDVIDSDCDDESNACDWDKFHIYLHWDLKEPTLLINGRPEPGAVVVGQHGKGDDAMVWVYHPDGTYTTEHREDVV